MLRKILLSFILFISCSALAIAALPDVHVLLNAVTANGNYKMVTFDKGTVTKQAQAVIGGASADSATVTIQGSNDGTNWSDIAALNIASSPVASQVSATTITAPYRAMRGVVSAISGTGATVTLNVSE